MIELLGAVKSILENYFEDCEPHIWISHNPETGSEKLIIVIKITNDDSNDFIKDLMAINSKIRPLKKKFNLIGSFLINV